MIRKGPLLIWTGLALLGYHFGGVVGLAAVVLVCGGVQVALYED